MQYHNSLPHHLTHLQIPSKFAPGQKCPTCAERGEDGHIQLLELTSEDTQHTTSASQFAALDSPSESIERYSLTCSNWEHCSFTFSLGGVTATIPKSER